MIFWNIILGKTESVANPKEIQLGIFNHKRNTAVITSPYIQHRIGVPVTTILPSDPGRSQAKHIS